MTLADLKQKVNDMVEVIKAGPCLEIEQAIDEYEKDVKLGIYDELNTGGNMLQEEVDEFCKRIRL